MSNEELLVWKGKKPEEFAVLGLVVPDRPFRVEDPELRARLLARESRSGHFEKVANPRAPRGKKEG